MPSPASREGLLIPAGLLIEAATVRERSNATCREFLHPNRPLKHRDECQCVSDRKPNIQYFEFRFSYLEQVNLQLPNDLKAGTFNIVISAAGQAANSVMVQVQ